MNSPIAGKRYIVTSKCIADDDDGDVGLFYDEPDPRFAINSIALKSLMNAGIIAIKELPDPLPTAVESVIRWVEYGDNPHKPVSLTAIRTPEGTWIDQYGCRWSDESLSDEDVMVVFNAEVS